MKAQTILLLIFVTLLANSCNLINPDEETPAFIYIEELVFDGVLNDSHKITEIWIFQAGQMIGAFDLPARVPILDEGIKEIKFRAGIKNNGVSGNRIMYPFYEEYIEFVDLVRGEVDTIVPQYGFVDGILIPTESIAEFDDPGSNYTETSQSMADLVVSNDPDEVFGGTGGSGYIELTSEEFIWQANSIAEIDLPRNEFVFLELNYKCDNSFAVGLKGNTSSGSNNSISVIMNPTTDEFGIPQWNKIYIDLGAPISANPNAIDFNILFESILDTGNSDGNIWLDNIKVIHFE